MGVRKCQRTKDGEREKERERERERESARQIQSLCVYLGVYERESHKVHVCIRTYVRMCERVFVCEYVSVKVCLSEGERVNLSLYCCPCLFCCLCVCVCARALVSEYVLVCECQTDRPNERESATERLPQSARVLTRERDRLKGHC